MWRSDNDLISWLRGPKLVIVRAKAALVPTEQQADMVLEPRHQRCIYSSPLKLGSLRGVNGTPIAGTGTDPGTIVPAQMSHSRRRIGNQRFLDRNTCRESDGFFIIGLVTVWI